MAQFYISTIPPDSDVARCQTSQHRMVPITISGAATDTGDIKDYTGVVQSIERNDNAPANRRYRVTIVE
jgi:hypothetical protein